MPSNFTKDFNNSYSRKISPIYTQEQVSNWEGGAPTAKGKYWGEIKGIMYTLIAEGIPTLDQQSDLFAEARDLRVKANELDDRAFGGKTIYSGLAHNNAFILGAVGDEAKKAIAKDLKSNL